MKSQYRLMAIIIAVVLVLDQVVKIWVKTHMQIGEEIPLIGDWCLIHFVENEGMAFGMAFGGSVGKLILSLFRIVASGLIMYFILDLIKSGVENVIVVSLSLIFVGAVGNLVDSCFYGLLFNDSYYQVAQLFPPEGGYAGFLYGSVVDMFYLPVIDTVLPEWVPWCGGERFVFFNAIFNIADIAITIGVITLVVYYLFFRKKSSESEVEEKK